MPKPKGKAPLLPVDMIESGVRGVSDGSKTCELKTPLLSCRRRAATSPGVSLLSAAAKSSEPGIPGTPAADDLHKKCSML